MMGCSGSWLMRPGCIAPRLMADRRQPLAARVWGSQYRTWFWHPDSPRQNKRGKRRSAKRERQKARCELRQP